MKPEHFQLHEVVAGVWAAEADLLGASVGNAAIIDAGAGKTIVFDTFMTEVAAAELRRFAESLTGNEVHLAVNSHWHSDHADGNQVFGDVPIVATAATRDRLIAEAPDDMAAWQAEIDEAITALEEAAAGGDGKATRRLDQQRHLRASAANFRLTLPDVLIEDKLVVSGERTVQIETLGRGHTISDVFAWLPDERVLVTGDLCWHGMHPRMHDGFPIDWADYAEALTGRDPRHVISGHGPPGDAAVLHTLPAYFRAAAAAVEEVRAGADPEDVDALPGSEDWAGIARLREGLRALAAS